MRLNTTSVRYTVQGVEVNFHAIFNLDNRPERGEASRFPSVMTVCHNATYLSVYQRITVCPGLSTCACVVSRRHSQHRTIIFTSSFGLRGGDGGGGKGVLAYIVAYIRTGHIAILKTAAESSSEVSTTQPGPTQ